MKRVIRAGLIFLGILTCGIVFLFWLTWREVRQERLNQALIAAVKANNTEATIDLLNEGADANSREELLRKFSVRQRLMQAIRREPFQHSDPLTPLLIALGDRYFVMNGYRFFDSGRPKLENVPLVRALLDHGADSNQIDEGMTPLSLAIDGGMSATIHLLLAHGAKLTCPHDGYSPLCLAAASDRIEIGVVAEMLDRGADVNARALGSVKSPQDRSPLYAAIEVGRVDVVRLLIAHGADVTLTSQDQTPLVYARKGPPSPYDKFATPQERRQIIQLLKQAGAKK